MGGEGTERQHLIEGSAWHLADQVANRSHQAAPYQAKPYQQQHLALGVSGHDEHSEQPVHLARPPPAEAMGPQARTADLAVCDLCTWCGDHAVAVEMSTPAEFDAVPEDR